MARSKVDIVQIGWAEIASGSLAGPASFIGLDVNGNPVLVAASSYVEAGAGSGISHDGSTANGVLTFKDSDEATVESNLTFDGNTLTVSGDVNGSYVTVIDNDQSTNGHGLKVTSDGTGTGTNVLDVESASTTHFRIRGDGRVGMGKVTSLPSARLTLSGSGSDVDLSIDEYIQHTGDSNTTIRFTDDQITFAAGGSEELKIASDAILVKQYIKHTGDQNTWINFTDNRIRLNAGGNNFIDCEDPGSAPHKVRINNGGNNIDFVIKDNSNNVYFTADASTSRVGIGTDTPSTTLHVAGSTVLGNAASDVTTITGQLTASSGMKLTAPSGSLAGPASFLGLDTDSRVVQIAASDYVSAGGGTDTYTLTERGHAYMAFPHRKYLHYPGGFSSTYESSREWAKYSSGWGHSQATSIDTTPEEAFAYWATFVVPADCTVNSAIAWYKSNQTQNTYVGIYSADMSSADDSASNITFQEMKRGTSSGNTSGRSHKVTLTSLSNNSLSAGDLIAVALDGNQTSNTSWSAQTLYFQITLKITPS